MKQIEVCLRDQAALNEQLPVDYAFPKASSDQHNNYALGFTGLEQRERFEQLIGSRFLKPGATEDHDGGPDPFFSLNQFRLQQLKPDSDGAKLISLKKFGVLIGRDIG
jgi:hypothetical protein